jgi:uncharacterized protein (DUF433 family)
MQIEELIERDPEKMGGEPVFQGTRVPIESLFDYLEGGETLETFLAQFPSVKRDQAVAVLSASRDLLLCYRSDVDNRLKSMQAAASDELFLADLNASMEDFGHADQEKDLDDLLTMDHLAGKS